MSRNGGEMDKANELERELQDEYPWRYGDVMSYFSLPRAEREMRLERRVLDSIAKAWTSNRFYESLWREHGLKPSDFTTLADLNKLPTCTIEDFRSSTDREPPFGLHWDVDEFPEVDMVLSTGGTTGAARPMLVTAANRRALGRTAARVWQWVGVEKGDTVQVLAPFSLHGAAWLASWGLEQVGARLVPSGGGSTTPSVQQVELMRRFKPTALIALPNYLRIVAEAAKSRGFDPREFGIERILVGAELLSGTMRSEIEETWGAKVYDVYGTVDTLVWSSIDCDANRAVNGELGSHLWSDEIIAEILSPEGDQCAPGEYGDLTFTSWLRSVGPLFRFRTGDQAMLRTDPCPCGLDTPRISIRGRLDDRLRFHGVNLWTSSIEEVLHQVAPAAREYVVIAENEGNREKLVVRFEGDPSDSLLPRLVAEEFLAVFGIRIETEVVEVGSTSELTGQGRALKVKRIIDRREEG